MFEKFKKSEKFEMSEMFEGLIEITQIMRPQLTTFSSHLHLPTSCWMTTIRAAAFLSFTCASNKPEITITIPTNFLRVSGSSRMYHAKMAVKTGMMLMNILTLLIPSLFTLCA
jgi:hypothetical protein